MCPAFEVRLLKQTILGTPIVHVLNGEKKTSLSVGTTRAAHIESSQTDVRGIHFRHSLPENNQSTAMWLENMQNQPRMFGSVPIYTCVYAVYQGGLMLTYDEFRNMRKVLLCPPYLL